MPDKLTVFSAIILAVILSMTTSSVAASDTQHLRTNGFDMPYVEKGTGPLLILIHGSFSDHRTWQNHMDLFASSYRVIAPTLRYFGTADWQEEWPSYSDRLSADDIAGFINALGAGPAHLVGWSRGGRVAHLTSLIHPKVVRSAYLFEGIARVEPARNEEENEKIGEIMQAWGEAYATANSTLKEEGPVAAVPHYIDAVAGKTGAFQETPYWAQQMFIENARTIPITAQAEKTLMTCQQIMNTSVPTSLVVGAATARHFNLIWQAYEPCLRSDQLMKIDGAAHNWPRVDPQGFFQSVKSFTSRH